MELAIFGCSESSLVVPTVLQQSLTQGMTVAKRLILKEWKSPSPPCFQLWLTDMVSVETHVPERQFTWDIFYYLGPVPVLLGRG